LLKGASPKNMEIQIIADPVNYNKNVQVYILIDIASEIYPFLR